MLNLLKQVYQQDFHQSFQEVSQYLGLTAALVMMSLGVITMMSLRTGMLY
ncbi:MAG: hypothetical protein F6K03_06525 [Kamptonema sp. SIO4C4]|nr:hypothetical protein [Kamptonema sp. SIO4C4]